MLDSSFERTFGPFILTVTIEPDYDVDLSWLGKYISRFEPGAIDRSFGGSRSLDRNEYRYFMPENPVDVKAESACYSKKGMSKHEANCAARSMIYTDYEEMEAINNGHKDFIGIVAVVSYDGREIGESSLWGIESDSYEDQMHDVIYDAICNAQGFFQRLEKTDLSAYLLRARFWMQAEEKRRMLKAIRAHKIAELKSWRYGWNSGSYFRTRWHNQ
jgi:hypothetical protein